MVKTMLKICKVACGSGLLAMPNSRSTASVASSQLNILLT